jgi:hypothetical protein
MNLKKWMLFIQKDNNFKLLGKMKEKIGNDAGRIWNVLHEEGTKGVKELKKSTKLTEKEIYAAVGWLAREEKLLFDKREDDLYVTTVD